MCGLFGAIAKNKQLNTGALKALAIANESRGDQSTGLGLKNGHIETVKAAISASEFVKNWPDMSEVDAVIGHTRWATTGKVTDANAHPFTYGHLTGTHNGMINNYAELGKYEVDSEAVLDVLSRQGTAGLAKVSGAAALAWLTDDSDALYLVSHNNPLAIAITPDALYYSSEYYHLASVMTAAGLEVIDIYDLEPDTLYTIGRDLSITTTPVKFKKPDYKSYSGYKGNYSGKGWTDYSADYDDDGYMLGSGGPDYSDNDYASGEYSDEDVERDMRRGLYSGRDLVEVFDDISQAEGCYYCGDVCEEGYIDTTDYQIICEDCSQYVSKKNLAKLTHISYSEQKTTEGEV